MQLATRQQCNSKNDFLKGKWIVSYSFEQELDEPINVQFIRTAFLKKVVF